MAAHLDHFDAEAELRVRVLERWHLFNPARSSARTFADRVARSAALNLLEAARASKRGAAVVHVELDEELDAASPLTTSDLAFDVHRVLATLSPEDRRICKALVDLPVAAAAEELGLSRASLRRRIEKLAVTFGDLRVYLEAA